MKYHLVIPTIMTNPSQEFDCLEQLVTQFDTNGIDFTIYFVANIPIKEFIEYEPIDDRIIKSVSNLEFSISRAINSIYEKINYKDEDILGFIQSDTFFNNSNWIVDLTNIAINPEYKAGVLGLRPHRSCNVLEEGINYESKFDIHPCEWTDGVMIFTGETFRTIGAFDENYFGDCESQDFCYQVKKTGKVNYWCNDATGYFGYVNRTTNFGGKARFNQDKFHKKVKASREYLAEKWNR